MVARDVSSTLPSSTIRWPDWRTYHVDDLNERELDVDLDLGCEVLHGSNQRVVAVEDLVDQFHLILAAQTCAANIDTTYEMLF